MRTLVTCIIYLAVTSMIRDEYVQAAENNIEDHIAQNLARLKAHRVSAFALVLGTKQGIDPLSRWLSVPALFVRFDASTSDHACRNAVKALFSVLNDAPGDTASYQLKLTQFEGKAARLPSNAAAGVATSLGLDGPDVLNKTFDWWCLHALHIYRVPAFVRDGEQMIMLRGWQPHDRSAWSVSGTTNGMIDRAVRAPSVTQTVQCHNTASAVLGGGLHPAVQFKWGMSFKPRKERNDELARFEVLLVQLLPSGAYFDLDELEKRHNFQAKATLQSGIAAGNNAQMQMPIDVTDIKSGSSVIDIERPAHISSQHAVEFALSFDIPQATQMNFTLELILPFHVRYPEPEWLDHSHYYDGRKSSLQIPAVTPVSIHAPLLFHHLINEVNSMPEPFKLVELTSSHSPSLITLRFPAGEGWRVGMIVTVTALVHVVGLLWVTWELFIGK